MTSTFEKKFSTPKKALIALLGMGGFVALFAGSKMLEPALQVPDMLEGLAVMAAGAASIVTALFIAAGRI